MTKAQRLVLIVTSEDDIRVGVPPLTFGPYFDMDTLAALRDTMIARHPGRFIQLATVFEPDKLGDFYPSMLGMK